MPNPASPPLLLHSPTAGNVPASLLSGQIAINEADGIVFWRDPSGTIRSAVLKGVANLASPIFTGAPQAPTPAAGDSSTVLATTAFVQAAVQAALQGLSPKQAVRAATTGANIALSGLQTIDGVALAAGDRVLVKDQTSGGQNGIWVAAAGGWTRAADFDANAEAIEGSSVIVAEGTANGDTGWMLATPGPVTLGTTALSWVQFASVGSVVAGAGLVRSGNVLSVLGWSGLVDGSLLKISGGQLVAAVAGTDYLAPGTAIDPGTF